MEAHEFIDAVRITEWGKNYIDLKQVVVNMVHLARQLPHLDSNFKSKASKYIASMVDETVPTNADETLVLPGHYIFRDETDQLETLKEMKLRIRSQLTKEMELFIEEVEYNAVDGPRKKCNVQASSGTKGNDNETYLFPQPVSKNGGGGGVKSPQTSSMGPSEPFGTASMESPSSNDSEGSEQSYGSFRMSTPVPMLDGRRTSGNEQTTDEQVPHHHHHHQVKSEKEPAISTNDEQPAPSLLLLSSELSFKLTTPVSVVQPATKGEEKALVKIVPTKEGEEEKEVITWRPPIEAAAESDEDWYENSPKLPHQKPRIEIPGMEAAEVHGEGDVDSPQLLHNHSLSQRSRRKGSVVSHVKSYPTMPNPTVAVDSPFQIVANGSFSNFSFGSPLNPNQNAPLSFSAMQKKVAFRVLQMYIGQMRALNRALMNLIKLEMNKVIEFYTEEAAKMATGAGICIDRVKLYHQMNSERKEKVEKTAAQVYYGLNMLQQYCDHNYLFITKLLTEFETITDQKINSLENLESLPFYIHPKTGSISMLKDLLYQSFVKHVTNGDVAEAEIRLKLRDDTQFARTKPLSILLSGISLGVFVGLSISNIMLYASIKDELESIDRGHTSGYWFGMSAVILFLAVMFPLNVFVWERYGVNFPFSLQLHPLKHWTSMSLLATNVVYVMIWSVCVFGFLDASDEEIRSDAVNAITSLSQAATMCNISNNSSGNFTTAMYPALAGVQKTIFPAYVWPFLVFPLFVVAYVVQWLISPSSPQWLLTALGRILVTPYFPVRFADFFICEQLVTIASTMFEMQFVWCAFHNDNLNEECTSARHWKFPVLWLLPLVWRILQSLRKYFDQPVHHRTFYPNGVCAVKYTFACCEVISATLWSISKHESDNERFQNASLGCYIAFLCVDMIFKSWYEIWIEFGIFRMNAKHCLLRDDLIFPVWSYHWAWIVNILLRSAWVFHLLAHYYWSTTKHSEWNYLVFAMIEIVRRLNWNFFRVECDQVDNTESYKFVKVAPMLVQHRSKLAWEVTDEELHRRFGGLGTVDKGIAYIVLVNLPDIFSGLSKEDRIEILTTIFPEMQLSGFGDPSISPNDQHQKAIRRGSISFAARKPSRSGEEASDSEMRPPDVVPTFVIDPKTGARKTPAGLFMDLPETEKVRAFMLFVGEKQIIAEYVDKSREDLRENLPSALRFALFNQRLPNAQDVGITKSQKFNSSSSPVGRQPLYSAFPLPPAVMERQPQQQLHSEPFEHIPRKACRPRRKAVAQVTPPPQH